MTPQKFEGKVKANLMDGRVFPPLGGTIGTARIAATVMGAEGLYRGAVLLANTDPLSDRVLRLRGAIGEITIDQPGGGITSWGFEVGMPSQALRSLVDEETFSVLTNHAPEPLALADGEIITLRYHRPSDYAQPPTLNGISFEDFIRYP
jgi:hypothetical protein